MGYNHGLEKKKFDIEWQKNEKLYRELGMTDEQISAIWEFDYKTFRSDRAYYEKKSDLLIMRIRSRAVMTPLTSAMLRKTGTNT